MSSRRSVLVLVALVLGTIAPGVPQATAGEPGTTHLPDLQTKRPRDLRIVRSSGAKRLQLTNEIWNAGDGPLDVRPENSGSTTVAYQRLMSHDAGGDWYAVSERSAGTFVFHSTHDHWHFEGFSKYDLRAVGTGGQPGSLVRTAGKISFCIVDTTRVDATLPHASPKTYTQCNQTAGQGLSVGWSDTYAYYQAGQSIDITGVANGTYWLVSTADPDNRLLETIETNNAAQVKIRIRRSTVTIVA